MCQTPCERVGHRNKAFPRLPIRSLRGAKPYFGAHGDEEIPVLIPNTEVKLISGDYTAKSGKLARCRIIQWPLRIGGVLLFKMREELSKFDHM
jgi:hypothetical protein